MSIESYRAEALGEELPPERQPTQITFDKIGNTKLKSSLDKVRRFLMAVDMELMENEPDTENIALRCQESIRELHVIIINLIYIR